MTIKFTQNYMLNNHLYYAGEVCMFSSSAENSAINAGAAVTWPMVSTPPSPTTGLTKVVLNIL